MRKIRITESRLREMIRGTVDDILSRNGNSFTTTELGNYPYKYEEATNVIDHYQGMTDSCHKLSPQQREQLRQAVDFLKDTDANDNPEKKYWIEAGEAILKAYGPMESRIMGLVRGAIREALGDGQQLYKEVRFVDPGDDDYDEIDEMFCGKENAGTAYCAGYSQPVIDYLKQWDDPDDVYDKLTPEKPRLAKWDSVYHDENGEYVLLYNSSIGGNFLLFRMATPEEVEWYNENN